MNETLQTGRLPAIPTWFVVAVGVIIGAAFVTRDVPWHLEDYDQAKQAFASLEISEGGSPWFQHTPRGAIATKPPLMAWMSFALADWLGIPWDFAWRLPSLVATLLIFFLIWRTAGARYGRSGALLAVAAFSLTIITPRLTVLVRTDMLLAATVFYAGLLSYRRVQSGREWDFRGQVALGIVVTISCFLKGPLIFVFVFLPLVVAALLGRYRGSPRLKLAWAGFWPWLVGVVPFVIWVVIGINSDEAFRDQVVVREFAGRFSVGEGAVHNNQPFYFYVVHLMHKLFPWSLILVASLVYRPVRRRLMADEGTLFLILWAGVALFIMSVVPSKRVDRVFPIVPIVALLIPACASAWFQSRRWWEERSRGALTGAIIIAVLVSGGYAFYEPFKERGKGALAAFALRVRSSIEVEGEGLRLALVRPGHESLYLYFRGATSCAEMHAAKLWNRGEIDGIVISPERFVRIEEEIEPFVVFDKESSDEGTGRMHEYLFVIKGKGKGETKEPGDGEIDR